MTIFALSGPILLSGTYEASIDQRVLTYVHENIQYRRLSTTQRARLLLTILVGNLDMLNVPVNDNSSNTPLSHIDDLLAELTSGSTVAAVKKMKTRLRTMLAAQYSFGVTVGAPVIFFCGSFLYTLIDNFSNLGDNDTSHALGRFQPSLSGHQSDYFYSLWGMVDDVGGIPSLQVLGLTAVIVYRTSL